MDDHDLEAMKLLAENAARHAKAPPADWMFPGDSWVARRDTLRFAAESLPRLLAHIAALTEERDGLKAKPSTQEWSVRRDRDWQERVTTARTSALKEAAEVAKTFAAAAVGNTMPQGGRDVALYEQGIGAERVSQLILALSQK